MRHVYWVMVLAATAIGVAFAQIPNAGFESWTGGTPDGWSTSNAAPVYTNVTQSSTAHGGSYAVRGEVVTIGGPYPIQPIIQSGPEGEGFPISSRPTGITGWYRFSPVGGDRFGINVVLFKGGVNGTAVASAAAADSTSHASYTQFNVPFTYFSAETPDTCVIQHQIIGPTTGITWHVGSWFLLDDLAFSGTNAVNDEPVQPKTFQLFQNYPNPFNPTTSIRYGVGVIGRESLVAARVRLAVYDILGREVAVLMDEYKMPGTYRIEFDGAKLVSGVYIYRLTAGSYVESKRMLLLK